MSALAVELDPALDAFVEKQVRSGAFPDAPSVVRAGLDLLRQDDAARQARFNALIQEGLDDLEAGRYETVDDIEAWLAKLGPQE